MRIGLLKKGFTIIELLIVIVVIGIIASLTLVGYSVVLRNVADASLQTDVNKIADLLDAQSFDAGYPSSLSVLNNGAGPFVSPGTVLQYTGGGATYCVTAFSKKANNSFYRASGTGSVQTGMCPGHTNPFVVAPNMTWSTISPTGSHSRAGIAASSDGTKVAVGEAQYSPGYIYTSTTSGASWVSHDLGSSAGGGAFLNLRMSSDGTIIAAISSYNRGLYVSTDSGATWTQRTTAPASAVSPALAMSSDGQKIIYGVTNGSSPYTGYLYLSTNAGSTWTSLSGSANLGWSAAVMSDDGTKLIASSRNGYIYTSSNAGSSWTQQTATAGFNILTLDTSSSTGVTVGSSGDSNTSGYVYLSKDYGVTWVKQTALGAGYWSGVGISDSGSTILVGADGFAGVVSLTTNTGDDWTTQTSFPSYPNAKTVEVAGDGRTLYVAGGSGGIVYKASF